MFDTAFATDSLISTQTTNSHNENLFQTIKGILRADISETDYRSWIHPLSIQTVNNAQLTIAAPTRFVRDWVRTHYADRILKIWAQQSDITPARADIVIASKAQIAAAPVAPVAEIADITPAPANENAEAGLTETLSSPLDPRLTFTSFITGPSNALAHAAALRVAEGQAAGMNPLYFHSGVGLGKTHLMQAIGAKIRRDNPSRKVIYMSAEKFMFQFVRALRARDTMTFKEQFRNIDVLMIDDIQFICGKESTQQEFFHTFNTLIDQGKQVILSADRAPADLDSLDDRLRSRLGMGLVASIQPATAELRQDILTAKCAQMKKDIPSDVISFLADNVTRNIREMEGALNRLIAHAELINRPVTMESTQDILKDILKAADRRVSIEEIQTKVASFYNLRLSDILSPRRARPVARPRQIAMYLSKILTPHSLPDIGRKFGGRDHTTIIHGVRKIEELMAIDPALLHDVEKIKRDIGAA